MAGLPAWRWVACALALAWSMTGFAPRAKAIEAFDDRLQAHGFVEMQIRGLSRDFAEEFDLAQWYNVLNVEIEADILPDGWGPFDLLQAYVRVEGRYDCVYTGACGLFPSASTYGNDSKNLPRRLRDAKDDDYGGVVEGNDRTVPSGRPFRIDPNDRDPVSWSVQNTEVSIVGAKGSMPGTPDFLIYDVDVGCPINDLPPGPTTSCLDNRPTRQVIAKREGFPGFDTLFDSEGADGEIGPTPDFTNPELPGFWLPDAPVPTPDPGLDLRTDYGPVFRGLADLQDDPAFYTLEPVIDWKFTFRRQRGPRGGAGQGIIMGPWLPKNEFGVNATLVDRAHPMRGREVPTHFAIDGMTVRTSGIRYHELDCENGVVDCVGLGITPDPVSPDLRKIEALSASLLGSGGDANMDGVPDDPAFRLLTFPSTALFIPAGTPLTINPYPNNDLLRDSVGNLFGGDYSGVIPCFDTDRLINRANPGGSTNDTRQLAGQLFGFGCVPYTNVRVTGGEGELPMRPAPDVSNLALLDKTVAQGLYIPSRGLLDTIQAGKKFSKHEFNINEDERAFNRGASQQETYEVKEAYFDAEFFDSRLWIRAGIQNVVWGKTELFRTTDQFNPVDFALASLPSLEESRIALLSGRAVWSFYQVGPLEDVRAEFAFNFDRNQPSDLGACGEPYTFDIVCGAVFGLAVHGLTGIGLAGVTRPPAPWDDIKGTEFGGRIEFRWSRFSVAIIDFYGFNDFPYPDPIFFYDRNVDPNTGRPLVANSRGRCENAAAFTVANPIGGGPVQEHAGNSRLEYTVGLGDAAVRAAVRPTGEATAATNDDYWRRKEATTILGIGIDPDCLKPGGAPGSISENRFDPSLAPDIDEFLASNPLTDYSSGDTGNAPEVGTFVNATEGQWQLEGSSVDYALAYHPANQQLFHFICSGTIAIATALAPAACAFNIFGTARPLAGGNEGLPFSEVATTIAAGDTHTENMAILIAIEQNTKNQSERPFPLATLNSDIRDGRTTAMSSQVNRAINFFGTNTRKDNSRDPFDLLSLDNTLTAEQRALLGCGPFFGTRCDSSAPAVWARIGPAHFGIRFRTGVDERQVGTTQPPNAPDMELESAVLASIRRAERTAAEDCGPMPPSGAVPCLGDGSNFNGFIDTMDEERRSIYIPVTSDNQIIDESFGSQVQRVYGFGGGIDFLYTDGSMLVQSFPGVEGTPATHRTTANIPQPGTTGLPGLTGFGAADRAPEPFVGGPVCTRFDPSSPFADSRGLVVLPGCRGALSMTVNNGDPGDPDDNTVDVVFEDFYTPRQDGCIIQQNIAGRNGETYAVRAVNPDGSPNADLNTELLATCWNRDFFSTGGSYTRRQPIVGQPENVVRSQLAATTFVATADRGTLWHPFAGCEVSGTPVVGASPVYDESRRFVCEFTRRNFNGDFIEGNAQVFRSEMAGISWNVLVLLTLTSCNAVSGGDDLADEDCFDPNQPFAQDRCSYDQPQFCRNVKGFLNLAGVKKNDFRAGGNEMFGRRELIWHGGAEAVLKYKRRNVFGVSADFAEDVTKTNWGMEFTWIGPTPFLDNNSLGAISESSSLNLTVSVDRPTFINFMNANRTFFMNSQWFFQYLTDWEKGYTSQGPFNVLFTFAVFTGYYQDRLLPILVTVYDFRSQSGGFLPSVAYRFNEAFSINFGVQFWVGKGELVEMPVRGIAPPANRAGKNAYMDGTDNLIGLFRQRDEAFLRIRYTF